MEFFSWRQDLTRNLLREIRLEALDIGETADSRAASQGQWLRSFVEQYRYWLAETLQHTIRLEVVEHRALLSRTVLHGYV
jgi:hypothetical protein